MKNINRNFPWCDEYNDDSFTGTLNEKRIWSDEEYFKLDNEIYELSEKYHNAIQLPRELVWRIMSIFSYVMTAIGCHSNSNDGYEIENLDAEQLFERRERFQLVFEGFFKGEMPKEKYFEYGNNNKE
ncbi:Imm41 family immunity protein [Aeromonas veronii]|uniref:Imm41 family immunity protein n=1 Tax=Aeromonas veronii TaxID=654 RepID=UPI0038EEB354